MDQFSLYGPSPDEVTYASPQLTAQFLARALAAQNPAPVPAVFVRNWLRLLLRRGELNSAKTGFTFTIRGKGNGRRASLADGHLVQTRAHPQRHPEPSPQQQETIQAFLHNRWTRILVALMIGRRR
jgi:hypothetical protein